MIELKDFSIGFTERKLLDNVNVTFKNNSLTAFIGRNGSGKSTLFRAMCGLNSHYSGEILIDSYNIKEINRFKLASLIAYVNTQRPKMPGLKCREIVELGRSPYTAWHGKLSDSDRDKVDAALEMVNMKDYEKRLISSLSDGESQKIMIARAIAQDTPIIILDEPTSFLDLPTRHETVALLKQLAEGGKTILYSTHELDIALQYSDEIALITEEKLVCEPTSTMAESSYLKSFYGDSSNSKKWDLHKS